MKGHPHTPITKGLRRGAIDVTEVWQRLEALEPRAYL